MSQSKLHPEYLRQKALQEALLARRNHKSDWYNGIYDRWDYPVLTREHIPLEWRFDLDPASNPYFMERLGVNAVFNAGAPTTTPAAGPTCCPKSGRPPAQPTTARPPASPPLPTAPRPPS